MLQWKKTNAQKQILAIHADWKKQIHQNSDCNIYIKKTFMKLSFQQKRDICTETKMLTDNIITIIHLDIFLSRGHKIQLLAMDSCKILFFLILHLLFITVPSIQAAPAKSKLFREYIGAEFQDVTFSDVPINPNIEFHFSLSFAIDYSSSSPPSPTNGDFIVYWDTKNLTPSNVYSTKANHSNVKVALSLGGDTIQGQDVHFKPTSIDSWVTNAIKSITQMVRVYNLDGIDIDYEHFTADPNTFA